MSGVNILRVTEQGVLVLTDLDSAATELKGKSQYQSIE